MRLVPFVLASAWIALLLASSAGADALGTDADGPEWETLADVETVTVVTTNDDGTLRDTTVWLAVLDGQGYIRTGDTRWGEQVVADPNVVLRIGEAERAFYVQFVEDDTLRAQIEEAFREKYGFVDRVMSWLRGSHPKIMRLTNP